uniref:Tripartite motif containing 35-13 n=1 Tax=Esox lucius TaxID=8010 RepID=A0A6Q2XMD3_ESOLU
MIFVLRLSSHSFLCFLKDSRILPALLQEMAERALLNNFLPCYICSETFREPVSLVCHHSFCSSCLDNFWSQAKNKNCPVCKRRSSKNDPGINFSLKALADSYVGREKEEESEEKTEESKRTVFPNDNRELVCTKHKEEPKWFCEVEQGAVCHVCEFPAHQRHKVIPIQQAVKDLKEKLASDLESLNNKQEKCKNIQKKYNEIEARLAALREEEKKEEMITREIKNIQDQISSLTESITTSLKAQYKLPDPQLVSGALIDVAKHLGNLQFRVWEKMQGIIKYTPVILDPNTANPWLSLSDDLTSVKYLDQGQQLPDNPGRNTKYAIVLCSEGFSSGKHSWEVKVGDHPDWNIGVVKESVNRKEELFITPHGKFTNGLCQTITLKKRPQRIRVHLDYDRGEVSFYDPEDMTHIYTHKDSFTEKLLPYFSIGVAGDMCIAKKKNWWNIS